MPALVNCKSILTYTNIVITRNDDDYIWPNYHLWWKLENTSMRPRRKKPHRLAWTMTWCKRGGGEAENTSDVLLHWVYCLHCWPSPVGECCVPGIHQKISTTIFSLKCSPLFATLSFFHHLLFNLGLQLWRRPVIVAKIGRVGCLDAEARVQISVQLEERTSTCKRSRLRAVELLQLALFLPTQQSWQARKWWWVCWARWVTAAVGVTARGDVTRARRDFCVLRKHILSLLCQAHCLDHHSKYW